MEPLKHECGVAMVRLLKPLSYYEQKYGTWMYGLNKLYLLMEKQHNRGQEGAGLACVKMEAAPGEEFMFRERGLGGGAIQEIFAKVQQNFTTYSSEQLHDADFAARRVPFAGEIYMGHLRYSTTGKSGLSYVHPFMRRNNWRAKNLCICANFNMTNVPEIFDTIAVQGQHPRMVSDTGSTARANAASRKPRKKDSKASTSPTTLKTTSTSPTCSASRRPYGTAVTCSVA